MGFGGPGGVGEEFFEEAAKGAGFDLLEAGGEVGWVEGCGAEVAEVGVAVDVPEDVVGVEVAVIDVVSVEVMGGGGDAAGDGEGGGGGELERGGVDVAGARVEGGGEGEGLVGGVDEGEDEAFGLGGVVGEAAVDGDEVGMGAGGEGGLHFGGGEAITGDGAFEEFDGDGLGLIPEGAVDGAGGAFAELGFELEGGPGDVGEVGGKAGGSEGVAD